MKTILILSLFLLSASSPYSKAAETAEEKSYYTKGSKSLLSQRFALDVL